MQAVPTALIPWCPSRIIGITGDSVHPDAQYTKAQVGPDTWITEIQTNLKDNILPNDSASADRIARLAKRYTLVEGGSLPTWHQWRPNVMYYPVGGWRDAHRGPWR
jgi:hypothetical protein